MSSDYLDFDVAVKHDDNGYTTHVTWSPAGTASAPFSMPLSYMDLAQFVIAVGPPRVSSRRLVPAAARVVDVRDYGQRLSDALLSGDVGTAFRKSLSIAKAENRPLRLTLSMDQAPDLEQVPWEYLYDAALGRFITLSSRTPVVRRFQSLDEPPPISVTAPLRVLVMISSPSDAPPLAVDREEQLLRATTHDLVESGSLELVVMKTATLVELQRALISDFHVFHFIGHGGFDSTTDEGVLVLETDDGKSHRVSGARLGTLLHDATTMQLAVLNACEGARSSGRDPFSGVGQSLVRQGLPAVVAMQSEISDRAALVFSHEFYYYLTRGLPIDGAMCEVRKAMAISDEASEWGTAVLMRSGAEHPFNFTAVKDAAQPTPEGRWEALYDAAKGAIEDKAPATALPLLEQLASEVPDYADVTMLLEKIRPKEEQPVPEGPPPTPDSPDSKVIDSAQPDTRPIDTTPPGGTDGTGTQGPRQPVPPLPDPEPNHRVAMLVGAGVLVAALVGGYYATRGGEVPVDPTGQNSITQTVQTPSGQTEPTSGQASETTHVTDPVVAACGEEVDPGVDLSTIGSIACTLTPPVIDGNFGEWENVPGTHISDVVYGDPVEGLASEWRVMWDTDALYVAAAVQDTNWRAVASPPSAWWMGDSINFEIGPDPADASSSDGARIGEDNHVIIALLADGEAKGAINPASSKGFKAGGQVDEIQAVGGRDDSGYTVEAKIPWDVLGVGTPLRGAVLGLNANVSDAWAGGKWTLHTMISSNPIRTAANQAHPATWQRVALVGP